MAGLELALEKHFHVCLYKANILPAFTQCWQECHGTTGTAEVPGPSCIQKSS